MSGTRQAFGEVMTTSVDWMEQARAVRLMAFDVDGVLTDGRLYFSPQGEEFKTFNTLDGHGLKMLQQVGIKLAIITGRESVAVTARMRQLGIDHVFQGVADKVAVCAQVLDELGLSYEQLGYMGDDVLDLPLLRRAGFAVAVPDAPALVHQHVDYITTARGGRGAVREACELVLRAQGRLDELMAAWLA